jgi:hypothetical protein
MNVGQTLFAQIMAYVPWKFLSRTIERFKGDLGIRTFGCAELFRVMAFAQLTARPSLRSIEACLSVNQSKLFHMGLGGVPARSTLAEALNSRDWRIYHALAMRLIERARELYASEELHIEGLDLDATVYALDSTTVDLCLSMFDWALFRTTKAAVKLHTLLDLRGAIPSFIHVSNGKMADVRVLDILPIEPGSYYVMDRGYVDFKRLFALHTARGFFVTRAKRGLQFRRVYSAKVDKASGVMCDQTICLTGQRSETDYPEQLRRIRFKDETGKVLVFLTNNMALPAATIAALYKSRWQVELFFKWIKQHLDIQHFLGTSQNAVRVQLWCAIATYVLAAIVKKEIHAKVSLYTFLQIFQVASFERIPISCALQRDAPTPTIQHLDNQLILFDF